MSGRPPASTSRTKSDGLVHAANEIIKPLGTFCEFKYGRSLPSKDRQGGDFPVYGSNGIVGWHHEPITNGPTIIIGRKGSVGALQYSTTPCCPIDTTYFIDRSCTTVDLRWLFFMLQMLGLDALNKHAAVPGLNRNDAYEKRLLVPSSDGQRQIAAVLEKADDLGRLRQESIRLTEKLFQSTFLDMFGDVKANPKGWNQCLLEDLCERIIDCPHNTPVYSETPTDFYCVRSSEIQNGRLDLASSRYVSERVFAQRTARHEPQAGEVIYTREGGRLGYAAQVPKGKRICLGQRMMLFSGKKDIASNAFLNGLLNSQSFRNMVLNLVGGGAAPRVNIKDLRRIIVYQPPIEIQLLYEQFEAKLTEQDGFLAISEAHVSRLFGSLKQHAFNGELDLSRLRLEAQVDSPPDPDREVSAAKGVRSNGKTFLIAPSALEGELERLATLIREEGPMPWSADYFKYRVLGTMPAPFSFEDLMSRVNGVFGEEPPYEEIKGIILDLLGQGGAPTLLRQRFDLTVDEATNEVGGRKEIVFEPVS